MVLRRAAQQNDVAESHGLSDVLRDDGATHFSIGAPSRSRGSAPMLSFSLLEYTALRVLFELRRSP